MNKKLSTKYRFIFPWGDAPPALVEIKVYDSQGGVRVAETPSEQILPVDYWMENDSLHDTPEEARREAITHFRRTMNEKLEEIQKTFSRIEMAKNIPVTKLGDNNATE